MRKSLVFLLCFFAVILVNAKNKRPAKYSPTKKHHTTQRTTHHQIRSYHPLIKPNVIGNASLDTSKNKEVDCLLSVLIGKLGKPYKRGAAGPIHFDCSGLISYAFSFLGIQLPRSSSAISQLGHKIALNELQPGDLLFFVRNLATKTKMHAISHVACVYDIDETGKILMIHSSEKGVNITDLNNSKYYMGRLVFARRILRTDYCSTPAG